MMQAVKAYWAKLDIKQRYIAAGGAALVLIILLLKFAVFPVWDARAKMKKAISTNSIKLEEMVKIDTEFAAQDAKISQIKRALSARSADFTLFSYLEKKAVAASVKGRITQMNSMQGAKSANFEETVIDLKLEKITIKQLTDFLYQIESPAEMIKIKRITVEKMKENPDYINVQVLIGSFTPASSRSGGQ